MAGCHIQYSIAIITLHGIIRFNQSKIKDILGRDASAVELSIFDTMWSEHCSYKSSKPVLKTLPTKGPNIMLGVGEDSGIIGPTATHDEHRYGIAVSHESHNHPSQVLPVEGAATGVGGVVRDVCAWEPMSSGLDSLHFGIPDGNGHQLVSHIADNVVKGIADYGHWGSKCGQETIYHESYNGVGQCGCHWVGS